MGLSLKDQLVLAGVVNKDHADRVEAKKTAEHFAGKASTPSQKTVEYGTADLETAPNMVAFCEVANAVLERDYSIFMEQVIQFVHRFKGQKGAKDLIWRVYQIRELYPKCPADKREQFLKRALRRHNPTVTIPV